MKYNSIYYSQYNTTRDIFIMTTIAEGYSLGRLILCPYNDCLAQIGPQLHLVKKLYWNASSISIDEAPHDGIEVRCPKCNRKIIACSHCNHIASATKDNRKYFLSSTDNGHKKRKHRDMSADDIMEHDNVNDNFEDVSNLDPPVNDLEPTNESVSLVHDTNLDPMNHLEPTNESVSLDHFKSTLGDIHSARYFFDNHRAGNCGGIKGIVYRCINNMDTGSCFANDDSCFADDETTQLYFDLLYLTYDMSDALKKREMRLVRMIFETLQKRFRADAVAINFPLSPRDLNQQVLRNKNSMSKQLPVEQIQTVDDKHAFISIGDTINTMMAHGLHPLGWLQDEKGQANFDGVNGSPAARRLLEDLRSNIRKQGFDPNKVAIGYVSPWSDGFVTSCKWLKVLIAFITLLKHSQ